MIHGHTAWEFGFGSFWAGLLGWIISRWLLRHPDWVASDDWSRASIKNITYEFMGIASIGFACLAVAFAFMTMWAMVTS